MPKIKPFFALRPNSIRQNEVISWPIENYSEGQARLILSENPYSFLHLVNPALDQPYLRGPRQDLLYKKIGENIHSFIENDVLKFDDKASIYIYQVKTDIGDFVGLWTLTSIDSYLDGKVKIHELTVARREGLLAEYLINSQLDANPVLIAYPDHEVINSFINSFISTQEPLNVYSSEDGHQHRIWSIHEKSDIDLIVSSFETMPSVYIADGHHRAAAMAKMALQRRALYKEDSSASFNFFTTTYFSAKSLKIFAFHRLVKGLGGLSSEEFKEALSIYFNVSVETSAYLPQKAKTFGLYWDKSWYSLNLKPDLLASYKLNNSPVEMLDVSILQDLILERLLNISDPRTDARLKYEGGNGEVSDWVNHVDHGHYTLLFTLYPASIEDIMDVADASQTMPPKSTWIAPKFKLGLMSHYIGMEF